MAISLTLIGVLGYLTFLALNASNGLPLLDSSNSEFDSQNRYILHNFDLARPMSNFLNGLATVWGIPLWAFYVNRGQAITSFGKQNKDAAIAKFVTVSFLEYVTCLLLTMMLDSLHV